MVPCPWLDAHPLGGGFTRKRTLSAYAVSVSESVNGAWPSVMSSIITYHERSSITPEEARNVRARVWAYVFACHARKTGDGKEKAGVPIAGNDAMKGSKHDRAARSIHN